MSENHGSLKSILLALGVNALIATAKSVAAVITGSGAMLAESIHSAADCGNQLLLLWGLKRAGRPADAKHPLGYGKSIYFWSFLVAIMLFSMGGLFSIYEGVHKLSAPEPLHNPYLAIVILAFSLVMETVALAGAVKQMNAVRGNRTFFSWFRTTKQSELIVILGEDAAAVGGLFFALVAIVTAVITGNPIYDAIGSIAIGIVLVTVALFIAVEIKGLLIGESADSDLEDAIRRELMMNRNISRVYSLITQQLGDGVMLAVKAHIKGVKTPEKLIAAINSNEKNLKKKFPEIKWIFFEPDVSDAD